MCKFDESLRETLNELVAEARGSYTNPDYPVDETERREAANVQLALKNFGYEVTLSDAASFWEAYSLSLQAGWLSGAETIKGAEECIVLFSRDCKN